MSAISKFYLHETTTTVGQILPGGSAVDVVSTISVTASGASTNRSMDGVTGRLQTSGALTTLAQTSVQFNWFRRWVSPPLLEGTVFTDNSHTMSFHIGASESNANSKFLPGFGLFLWTPSTGTEQMLLWDPVSGLHDNFVLATEPGTTETATSVSQVVDVGAAATYTSARGDVLILELYSQNTQLMSTAYTNTVFYDGTTEDSTSSNAAYVGMTPAIEMLPPAPAPAAHLPLIPKGRSM